ncbi:2-desacetyl-2-hydroxyethyl bacteriochlorophyllide A dehydrogenase [Pedobacter steynii]|uniref:2-desacetyl-2-hydroxyethyl bacteriochlorophyllide A dehydrogenase n=1 Tax=Pedobacter steynii TaxID=430522 RepID=A0A1G9W9K4_9SPHI|nr:zinc-binding alcohol dehydrogenase family protein [Pedobacter steynii]NQX40221.1 zinc-binding alcohol dehydrogenase family protein [Pedobacter steynii]SDM81139.1 2-desacetyl-2-hydroxyethyl bacteriochlorophyllide A dehydrogenase [Pedobacter steynii]
MKALICNTPGEFEYKELDMPVLKDGHTLLKVKMVGICGTDYHAYQGTQPFFNYPRILGHEIAAEVIRTSSGSKLTIGEKVTISPYFYCKDCVACRNGKTNCCAQMQVYGVHIDGAMREYIVMPDEAIIPGQGLTEEELVLVEPLAIGAHGISRANVKPGEFVLVIGAGPIGLGTMDFARIAGAEVIALDTNAKRLDFCKEKLGVKYIINAITDDVMAVLEQVTGGDMPTVVVDCTGNLSAINNAFQYMAHGARFVLIGLQKGEISFSHPEFHKREGTLLSSRNAVPADFRQVISCVKDGAVKPLDYITHRLMFQYVKDSFADLMTSEEGLIKAVVIFE